MRTQKSLIWFIQLMFFISSQSIAQEYYDTIAWVRIEDENFYSVQGNNFTRQNEINTLLSSNHVVHFEQALPFAKTPELLKIHEVRLNRPGNIEKLFKVLSSNFPGVYSGLSKFEVIDTERICYDPVDYMWTLTNQAPPGSSSWLWHLKQIDAEFAWDITRGDTNVKTAVLDVDPDVTHPDLESEIYPHFDPYTLEPFGPKSSSYIPSHGTTVASFVSAETTEQGSTAAGDLAAIGFNTRIVNYKIYGYYLTWRQAVQRALHASSVMGASVIVSCAGGLLRCASLTGQDLEDAKLMTKEILDNGTIIVMPAGNGLDTGGKCGTPGNYTPFWPFHPEVDDRIIIVTSTDSVDNHQHYVDGVEVTHSHFPQVDISAPGYRVMGATGTLDAPYEWPYYGSYRGTSFSAPIVAGVCALMKSIAPDLTPAEAKYIIKNTADPVADAHLFPGMVGAGRINAYEAVKMTGTRNIYNTTLTGNKVHSAGYGFNVANSSVGANSNISLKARIEVNIESSFVVPLGSSFEVIIDPDAINKDYDQPVFEFSLNVNWVQMGPTGQLQFVYSINNVSSSTKTFYLKGTANNDSMSTSTASHTLSAGHGTGGMLPITASTQPSNWKFYIREGDSNFTEANVVESGP